MTSRQISIINEANLLRVGWLRVGRLRRPTCGEFGRLKCRCFPNMFKLHSFLQHISKKGPVHIFLNQHNRNVQRTIIWAELWLVNKQIYCLSLNPAAGKQMFTLLDVGSFLKKSRIVSKSLPHPVTGSRRSIFHAAKSSQMPYTSKAGKS